MVVFALGWENSNEMILAGFFESEPYSFTTLSLGYS